MPSQTVDAHGKEHGEWDSMSMTYQNTIGRLTEPIVLELVRWATTIVPLDGPNVQAMDNGCGTGALCRAIKRDYPNVHLLATDYSSGMIEKVENIAKESGWISFEARVQDARDLSGVGSDSMTHIFSSFMICLAPDPDRIASEMRRALQVDGVLGLAVWGDPGFDYWEKPWTKACRELDPAYEPPILLHPEWTYAKMVEKELAKAGFKGVEVRSKLQPWRWDSTKPALEYFFDGRNPEVEKYHASWTERGGNIDSLRPIFKRKLQEAFGQSDGSLEGPVDVCLATARK